MNGDREGVSTGLDDRELEGLWKRTQAGKPRAQSPR